MKMPHNLNTDEWFILGNLSLCLLPGRVQLLTFQYLKNTFQEDELRSCLTEVKRMSHRGGDI